jgi:hypothetical protein
VAEDEFVDLCAFGDATDRGDVRVERGHSFEGGARHTLPLKVGQVGNLVHEHVGTLGESDQVLVHGAVAREHDGPSAVSKRYPSAGTAWPCVTATAVTRTASSS